MKNTQPKRKDSREVRNPEIMKNCTYQQFPKNNIRTPRPVPRMNEDGMYNSCAENNLLQTSQMERWIEIEESEIPLKSNT